MDVKVGETLQHTFSGKHEARNLFCTFLITLNRHHLCIWYQVLLIDLCVMSNILVSRYCWQMSAFHTYIGIGI